MATSADTNATSKAGYHSFTNAQGEDWGSFYVFFMGEVELAALEPEFFDFTGPGWYWQAEFPGCLPDGEPSGPFNTSAAAFSDATDSES